MKTTLIAILIATLTTGLFAQTNKDTLKEQVRQVAETNINQIVIEMLAGVKNASGDIYKASKTEITKAVDFAKEQAPQVVEQFLLWKAVSAAIWAIGFLFISSLLFYFSYRLGKWAKAEKIENDATVFAYFFKWALPIVACAFIFFGVGSNAMEIAKIKVAPKVYIIEYVVDVFQNREHRGQ